MTGLIKYFNENTGYGIIEYNLKEVEFRYTDISNIEYGKLKSGLEVEFLKIENGKVINGKILYR